MWVSTEVRLPQRFDGQNIGQLDDHALTALRLHQIGVIFQSFNLIPVISALENVMLPLQLQGVAHDQAAARAQTLLDEVGVGQHADRRPDKLSGGQRQRVAIARALVTNPKAVIADEPTANLDSENTKRIIELISHLNKEHQVTFIFWVFADQCGCNRAFSGSGGRKLAMTLSLR